MQSGRSGSVARNRAEAVGVIRNGLVRRRFRGAELRGVLVLFTFRSEPRDTGRHLLRSEPACRYFGAGGVAGRIAHRSGSDDGVYSSAIERFTVTGSTDAKCETRDCDVAAAFQHQSDGRADQNVLYDGGSSPPGTFGGGGTHRSGAHVG